MKIGTITFHWAVNYGAVLQAYALQKYLLKCGYETEVINYCPKRVRIIETLENILKVKYDFFIKKMCLFIFIKKNIKVSKNKYKTNKDLYNYKEKYDAIICGSDQIWNKSFTMNAEKKITLSYFLNFSKPYVKRIGYAVSFGVDTIDKEYEKAVKKELKKFHIIGVREKTGQEILSKLEIQSEIVCDPTLLLKKEDYKNLIDLNINKKKLFIFLLHKNQDKASELAKTVGEIENLEVCKKVYRMKSWISSIYNAKFIVTNSFHCMIMALVFNIPFIVVPVEGMSMNNRIQTILEKVGLIDRFLVDFNKTKIREIYYQKINWETINNRLQLLREHGRYFLNKNIKIKN